MALKSDSRYLYSVRQQNTLREKLENNDIVLGAQTVTHQPTIVEVYGDLGLDFVWIDFEHVGPGADNAVVFEDLTRAADVSGIELLVRLPSGDPELIRKVLDSGVRNLLIPRIETAQEVCQAIEASRFSYGGGVGERGIAASRSSGWGADLTQDYVDIEDQNTSVGVMIENTAAVDNLEEILTVDGLGFVIVGPSDLSVSMGQPLELDHPEIESTVSEIVGACNSHDVPVGRLTKSTEETKRVIDEGAQLVRISGGEIGELRSALTEKLEQLDEYR